MDEETAECWIVQYRVTSRSGHTSLWSRHRDYRKREPAERVCDEKRAREMARRDDGTSMEWRVLHVTQEVVY